MSALIPKELPDLRTYLANYMDGGYGPAIVAAQLHGEDPDRWDVEPTDVSTALADAVVLRRADLYYITAELTELLGRATAGVGDAGFMPFDLPGPTGFAYLDGGLACEAGAHRWDERAVILWQSFDQPTDEFPLGFVLLSWYVDRDVWLRESQFWYPDDDMTVARLRDVPKYLWDGHVFIGYSDTSATIRVVRSDRNADCSTDHRGRRGDTFRALCYLMRQRLACREDRLPDRAAQRRAKRSGREPESIRVLSLRSSSSDGTVGGRDYSHKWVVRGHWRRQWYASIRSHRPVFISSYIKGPADAPLIGGEKVYRVTG